MIMMQLQSCRVQGVVSAASTCSESLFFLRFYITVELYSDIGRSLRLKCHGWATWGGRPVYSLEEQGRYISYLSWERASLYLYVSRWIWKQYLYRCRKARSGIHSVSYEDCRFLYSVTWFFFSFSFSFGPSLFSLERGEVGWISQWVEKANINHPSIYTKT